MTLFKLVLYTYYYFFKGLVGLFFNKKNKLTCSIDTLIFMFSFRAPMNLNYVTSGSISVPGDTTCLVVAGNARPGGDDGAGYLRQLADTHGRDVIQTGGRPVHSGAQSRPLFLF